MTLGPGEDNTEQAVALIEQGEPPLAIRKLFPSFKEAVRFYASVRARQFGFAQVTDRCSACDVAPDDVVVEFRWTARFSRFSIDFLHILLLFVGHIGIPIKTELVTFSTFYGICSPCWRQIQRRRLAKNAVEAASILLIIIGVTTAFGCGLATAVIDHLTPTDKTELWACCGAGGVGVIAAIIIRFRCRLMGTPATLRVVAPRPFQLHSTVLMQEVSVQGSTTPTIVRVPKYRSSKPSALSWQQTVAILAGVFGGVTGLILAFAPRIDPPYPLVGWGILAGSIGLIVILTGLHIRQQNRIRAAYYTQMAEQLARGEKVSG